MIEQFQYVNFWSYGPTLFLVIVFGPKKLNAHLWWEDRTYEMLFNFSAFTFNSTCFFYGLSQKIQSGSSCWVSWRKLGRDICIDKSETLSILYWWTEEADKWPISVNFNWSMFKKKWTLTWDSQISSKIVILLQFSMETFDHWQWNCDLTMKWDSGQHFHILPEVEFVHAVSAGGSVKFLPAV